MMSGLGSALAELDLRPVEGTILVLVEANPGCIQSDLGRQLGIKRANMVPLITGLVLKNLLEKSPVDGRSLALTLTPDGEAACGRVVQAMTAHEARFHALLTDQELVVLRSALWKIAQADESLID